MGFVMYIIWNVLQNNKLHHELLVFNKPIRRVKASVETVRVGLPQ